jgi:NAD(P)-dependent dehydrogenase (short-subunit alcohol dehydrogenase family)
VGPVDHVVSTASARARGKLGELDRQKLQLSFDTRVIGPTMLAKYFAPQINPGGSFVLFSGVHAFKLNVGYLGVGITNGAVDFLTRWLAVELAPTRVNAISPGVVGGRAPNNSVCVGHALHWSNRRWKSPTGQRCSSARPFQIPTWYSTSEGYAPSATDASAV